MHSSSTKRIGENILLTFKYQYNLILSLPAKIRNISTVNDITVIKKLTMKPI